MTTAWLRGSRLMILIPACVLRGRPECQSAGGVLLALLGAP